MARAPRKKKATPAPVKRPAARTPLDRFNRWFDDCDAPGTHRPTAYEAFEAGRMDVLKKGAADLIK